MDRNKSRQTEDKCRKASKRQARARGGIRQLNVEVPDEHREVVRALAATLRQGGTWPGPNEAMEGALRDLHLERQRLEGNLGTALAEVARLQDELTGARQELARARVISVLPDNPRTGQPTGGAIPDLENTRNGSPDAAPLVRRQTGPDARDVTSKPAVAPGASAAERGPGKATAAGPIPATGARPAREMTREELLAENKDLKLKLQEAHDAWGAWASWAKSAEELGRWADNAIGDNAFTRFFYGRRPRLPDLPPLLPQRRASEQRNASGAPATAPRANESRPLSRQIRK